MLRSIAAGTSIFSLTPSRPAVKIAAIAKYGFADGSTLRNSIRVEMPRDSGIRINGERLRADHAIYTGASYPGTKRLYEFTVGLHTAVKAFACFMTPAMKWRQVSLRRWSPFSSKNALFPSSSNKDKLKCIPLPAIPNTGFGINVACNPCLRAMVFTTNLKVWMLSQAATASEYFQSISC